MTAYEIAAPDVIADTLNDEVVIINLDTGSYFRLTGDAATAWAIVTAGVDTDDVPAAVRRESERFVGVLVENGLLRPTYRAAVIEGDLTWPDGALDVEVYDDLQDLLNLDPVHDVPEGAEWPRVIP